MKSVAEATPILLTKQERAEPEGLARSTKTRRRLRRRARIALLSAAGLATRAIGREIGCTTGTASKWRVRYAKRRLAGLDETGERGNEPKYTAPLVLASVHLAGGHVEGGRERSASRPGPASGYREKPWHLSRTPRFNGDEFILIMRQLQSESANRKHREERQ